MNNFNEINNLVRLDYKNQIFETLKDIEINTIKEYPEFVKIIENPGKMIRSTLMYIIYYLEAEEAHPSLVELSIIIELIQSATLVHDDIMDDSLYRRGDKTIVNAYGLNSALLLGDLLLFIVMRLLADIKVEEENKREILKSISSCLIHMYEGQKSEELLIGNYTLSEKDYFKVISNKTSAFFSTVCEIGSVLAGDKGECRQSVVSYGYYLGLAYQMMDDLKSVMYLKKKNSDKSYQTDMERRLVTLPVIVAYENGDNYNREIIKEFYTGNSLNKDLVEKIISCDDVVTNVKERIAYYLMKAKAATDKLPENKYKRALQEYCDYYLKENL